MAMIPLRGIFTKLLPKLLQIHDFGDVLTMYDKGNLSEAYTILCKVMENETQWSKDGDVYTLWAELELLANHNPQKALEFLEKAQQIGCSEMGYYYNIYAEALWEAGEHEKALQYFEKSVAADPTVSHLRNLAWALSLERDKRAMIVWQQVLEKDPKNCLAYTYMGLEAAKSGDRSKALLMSKKAEELQSSVEDAYEIGRFCHELEEYQTAIKKYLEAKELGYDKEGVLYAAISDCYLSLREGSTAHKYVKLAIQSDPENEYVKEVLHEYQERFGK